MLGPNIVFFSVRDGIFNLFIGWFCLNAILDIALLALLKDNVQIAEGFNLLFLTSIHIAWSFYKYSYIIATFLSVTKSLNTVHFNSISRKLLLLLYFHSKKYNYCRFDWKPDGVSNIAIAQLMQVVVISWAINWLAKWRQRYNQHLQ